MEDNLTAGKIGNDLTARKIEDNMTAGKIEDDLTAGKIKFNSTALISWMFMLGLAVIQVTNKHLSNVPDHSFSRQPSSLHFKDFTPAAQNNINIWQL